MTPGTPARDILEARVASGASPASRSYAADRIKDMSVGKDYSIIDHLRDGRVIAINHQRMDNGGWVTVHQDITAQKRVEAELAHMARYDALTGLANRALFLEKVSEALARMESQGEPFSVLMLDLDRFKAVNDLLGHAIGDSLLKAVGDRLRRLVRDLDVVARLGGDEFAVIQISDMNQRDQAAVLANRILVALTEPYDIDGRKIVIGTSIGITLAPKDADDADKLVRHADLALYKAKSEGRNRYRFFETAMEADARDRRELEEDMRRALLRDEFELHYQTVIDVGRRECCGAEALVRWRHPERGLLFPDQFIGLAEESGLIMPLGGWILRRACSDAAAWPSHLKIAVNLSPVQLKQANLMEVLKSALKETGLDPRRLELEITETVLIEKSEENLAAPARDQESRRLDHPRRLRHRLFVDALSADVPVRQDQDRQVVHPEHDHAFRQRGDRVRDHRPRARSRHRDHRRRRRDRGAVAVPAHRRLSARAGLSVQPAGPAGAIVVRAPGSAARRRQGGLI